MGIKVSELKKVYGNQNAVDGISFEIGTGQIVGFLGPNGAGKTTTMKMLTCYLSPTSGIAWLDEKNILEHPLDIRKKIGYLPENNPLYTDMYVHEYLHFVGRLYQVPASQLKGRVEKLIETTGLTREQHKQIGMLSKGYRQRVGLAAAMIHDPSVLILDEPTTGLDPNQIIEIRNLIREIGKEKTVIFSTHILPEVEAIADRVIIIHRGKIVADENMDILRADSNKENVLKVEFEKEGFDFSRFQNTDGYLRYDSDGKNRFRIASRQDCDLRKLVFEESVRQDNPIYLLMKVEKSLEDIFRNLTQNSMGGSAD